MTRTLSSLAPVAAVPARGRGKALAIPDLALLGILMDGPQHGYEMRQVMQTRLGRMASITGGTIYYTLSKLERRGLVAMERGREGNRPERMVYSITPPGREEFRRLMKATFLAEDLPWSFFDVGMYFMPHGDLQDALDGAVRQVERLRAFEEHVKSLERDYPVRWPFHMDALKRHTLAVTRAHGAFYEDLAQDLRARIARARSRAPARPVALPSSRPSTRARRASAGRDAPRREQHG